MYDFLNKLRGNVSYTVKGAQPELLLNLCMREGVELMSALPQDEFTVCIRIFERHEKRFLALAARSQCDVFREGSSGAPTITKKLARRAVAAVLAAACVAVFLVSRLFIWEININGNEKVASGEILAVLKECGVEIGSFWPSFTSDSLRSEILVCIPELSWVTVNIYGSRAEVIVRERISAPVMIDGGTPADIIATKSGMVTDVSALIGDEQVTSGRAVIEGELLISGEMKSSFSDSRLVHAYGSVMAYTWYEITAIIPKMQTEKSYTGDEKSRFALFIGDRRINFYGNSSISDMYCDKIYDEWTLSVEGLFTLPISITREKSVFYEKTDWERDINFAAEQAKAYLREALLLEIGESGEILLENYTVSDVGDRLVVSLRAQCHEEIGKTVLMTQERIFDIQNQSDTKETR